MKRFSRKLGSILLMVCLLAALMATAAFADEDVYCDAVWEGTQGTWCEWDWATPDGMSIGYSCVDEGLLPDGIELQLPGSNLQPVSGTPTEYGNFYTTIRVQTGEHTYHVSIRFCINAASQEKTNKNASDSLSAKVGTALSGWSWGTENGENISDAYVSNGTMPSGLYIPTPGSNAFQICGTPTAAGSGNFTVRVETFDVVYYVKISYNIASANEEFKVTKSPTEETVKEGGQATFIASATGYNYVEWLFISGGNTVATYRGESNTNFGSCTVITYKNSGQEYLVLRNIPASMHEFMIQARFTNNTKGSILSQTCSLCVLSDSTPAPTVTPSPTPATDLKTPTISMQPSAVTQTVGNNAVLSVTASDPNGGTLNYQWYTNTAATSTGATAITGANQSSYTPPQTFGTMYYYCSITSTKDGKTSAAANTTPIAVTYTTADATSSPAASTSPSASPEVSPTASSAVNDDGSRSSVLMILLIVLIVLALVCLVFQIIYISMRNQGKAVPMVKWDCPECGTRNKAGTRFCSECGTKNPHLRVRK